jgi:hypothetical protein
MLVQYWEGLYPCEEEVLAATGDVPSDASRGRERILGRGHRWGYTGPDDGDKLLGDKVEHPSCLASPDGTRVWRGSGPHGELDDGGACESGEERKGGEGEKKGSVTAALTWAARLSGKAR